MIIKRLLLVLLLIVAVTASTCTPRSSGPSELRVGYISIIDCLPLYVAAEKGFFTQHGLHVTLTPLGGGPMILDALGGKTLDVGFSNVVTLLTARSKGLPFQTLGGAVLESDASRAHGLLVRSDSLIRTAQDLKGKRVAINAKRNIDQFVMSHYLEMNGLEAGSINYVEVTHDQMEALLVKGDLDATISVEPYLTKALANRDVRLLDYEYVKAFPTLLVASYIAPQEWLQAHATEAEAFRAALGQAREFIAQHQVEARALLPKYTRIDDAVAQQVHLPEFRDDVTAQDLEPISREMLRQKLIERLVPVTEVVYGRQR
jgi:NitT/TauT family transport system substrate-binding protein